MLATRHIAEIFKPAIDLIYPPRCPLCGDAIGEQNGVCIACWSQLVLPVEPWCRTCQRPLDREGESGVLQCVPCLRNPPRHDGIFAGTLYNDPSRKLVLAYKHGKRIALADMLARMMVARLPVLNGEWVFVPVPLHPIRLWGRGFNQSALLADKLAKLTRQTLVVDGLMRRKQTKPLGGMGRTARERMLHGAIKVSSNRMSMVENAKIVLVDDVLTSGATSDACVKALKDAGAAKVVISCFARVMDEALSIR